MWVVPEAEIAGLISRADAFAAVEAVFAAMARGAARNFPVVREALDHQEALFGFKGGFDRDGPALGVKAGGYWPHNQARRGLINHQSTVVLFDPDSGQVAAMVGGNRLTALRTAAAAAVSIRHLARPDAATLGIVGAGHQAAFQLRAALDARPFERVIGWNRTPARLPELAAVAEEAGLPFEPVDLPAMRAADVIVTITSSFAPILFAEQVAPGTHLACMGTDTKGKCELDPLLVAQARLFCDEPAQALEIGEAQHAHAAGRIAPADLTPLGAVIIGAHPGRISAEEITLFDGTGVGLQDLAVAASAVRLAIAAGCARNVAL